MKKKKSKFRTFLSGKNRRRIRPKIYDKCLGSCWICGLIIPTIEEMTLDHKLPVSKGGGNHQLNLMAAHKECNFKRGDKDLTYLGETSLMRITFKKNEIHK